MPGSGPEPLVEEAVAETHRGEVGVLGERAREADAAEQVEQVGEGEVGDLREEQRPGVALRRDEPRLGRRREQLARELDDGRLGPAVRPGLAAPSGRPPARSTFGSFSARRSTRNSPVKRR